LPVPQVQWAQERRGASPIVQLVTQRAEKLGAQRVGVAAHRCLLWASDPSPDPTERTEMAERRVASLRSVESPESPGEAESSLNVEFPKFPEPPETRETREM